MDDRFRSEDTGFNNNQAKPGPSRISKSNPLGDFSENIDSVGGKAINGIPSSGTPKAKKFQVTLPEEANLIPDIVPTQRRADAPSLQNVTGREYVESISNRNVSNRGEALSENKVITSNATQPAQHTRIIPEVQSSSDSGQPRKAIEKPAKVQKTAPVKPEIRRPKKVSARKRYNFINSVLVACVCVIFIAILTVTASTVAMTTINDILVINKGESGEYVSVYIEPGSDYDEVFETLKDAGLIKQPIITDFFCKFRHYDEIDVYDKEGNYVETRRIAYEAGNYYLDADMGVESMLESMMSSRMNSSDTVRLTFPEGWTIAQIFQKIEKYKVCEAEKLYANLDIIGSQYDFFEDITSVNGRYLKAEGYLFPDTYDFFIGENASSVIKKLFNNFNSKWKDEYNDRLDELGMSVDEIITIASIIQREAKDTTQMDDISAVIHNRLSDKATYPSIDMNSTKDYILSLKSFNILSDFYYNMYLNSYNTYSNGGLPPGPICNPGAAAIRAALYPSDNNYHFFCHDDSGNIYLAVTASEHQANAEKVLYGH